MINSFSNSIQTKKDIYFIPGEQGTGTDSTKSQGKASFNLHQSLQDDIVVSEQRKRQNQQLFNATTLDHNFTGGESLVLNGNQLMNQELNKPLSRSNQLIMKKGLQNISKQISPKYQEYKMLNINQLTKSQANFSQQSMKYQENQFNDDKFMKNDRNFQLQDENYFKQIKVFQPNSDPNRIQRIQSLKKCYGSKTSRIEPKYIQEDKDFSSGQVYNFSESYLKQQSTHVKNNSFSNKNLLQSKRKQSQSHIYQVQEFIPINADFKLESKQEETNKFYNLGNPLTNQQKKPSNIFCYKSKLFLENSNSQKFNLPCNIIPLSNELKNGLQLSDIIHQFTPSDRIDKMLKKIDESSSRIVQLKNKQKIEFDTKKNGIDFKSLKNKKLSLQQQIIKGYLINGQDDDQKNSHFNSARYEPSSRQFIAIKDPQKETKSQPLVDQLQLPISEVQENDFEQKQKIQRNSLGCFLNQNYTLTNRRQVSLSETRCIEQNLNVSQDNMKPNQNSALLSKKLKQVEQSDQIIENNIEQIASQAFQENKTTKRNSLNNNNIEKKQQLNKLYSGNDAMIADKHKPAISSIQSTPSYLIYQQKELSLKGETENTLQRKIKIYLDFQRVINFSNNMTIQSPQVIGVKIYKAYITKGNNGALIRAALKNRWWWQLCDSSEEYENINFLWTQWRKPSFIKIIKNREDLIIPTLKSEGDEEIKEKEDFSYKSDYQSNQINVCQDVQYDNINEMKVVSTKNINSFSNYIIKNQNSIICQPDLIEEQSLKSSIQKSDFIEEVEINSEKQKQQILLVSINERPGYNDASPTRNLQDYITKFQSVYKKQSQNLSPISRKQSQQLQQQDPFSKIAALVNEKDLEKIQKYVNDQKNKKLIPRNIFPPPIFSKLDYEDGIEQEYKNIRKGCQKQINVYKDPSKQKIHNHMEYNFHLSNKKALYYNMKSYYYLINKNAFDHLPVTFHIQNGLNDPEYQNFVRYYNKLEIENSKRKNVWIIKPGESSNRGNGIQVAGDIDSVKDIIKVYESHQNGLKKTYIIQKYIDRPFLYNKRKFDIRCFMLMTNYNNSIKAYWYTEGYIRTSTKEFTLKNLENRMIHLTNEAVQKRGDDFGKYENGNKLSYGEFQKYIDATYPKENYNFIQQVYPQMKQLAYDSVCSVYTKIDQKKRNFSFELFGLDFMIDENFKTWLIEINTNPSLTVAAPLMSRILTSLIDNIIKIAIDPIFPPPSFPKSKKHLIPEQIYENNKFELLFDSDVDGERISKLYQHVSKKIDEQLEEDCKNEEVYDDDDVDIDDEEYY